MYTCCCSCSFSLAKFALAWKGNVPTSQNCKSIRGGPVCYDTHHFEVQPSFLDSPMGSCWGWWKRGGELQCSDPAGRTRNTSKVSSDPSVCREKQSQPPQLPLHMWGAALPLSGSQTSNVFIGAFGLCTHPHHSMSVELSCWLLPWHVAFQLCLHFAGHVSKKCEFCFLS